MAFFRGPNIVKDNLVFGYDTGYPVVSGISDTYRFNSGEPTENLFPEPNYTITDGQVLNHIEFTRKPGQGYNGLDSLEGVVSSSYVSGQIQRRYTLNLAQGFHTHSFYVKKNCDFFRIEHLGTAQLTSGGTTQQQFKVNPTTGIITPSSGFTDYGIEDVGDWWKVWYKIEISGTGNAIFDYEPVYGIGKRFEICGSQIEAKSHPTPFTAGTRSATQSLINLKQTTDIDLSNVSFDSNAQIIFDGSDDQIDLGTGILSLQNSSFTLEVILKWDGSATQTFLGYREPSHSNRKSIHWRIYDSGMLRFDFYGSSINSSAGAIEIGNWYHLSLTYDLSTDTCKCYRNGTLLMQGSTGPYNGSDAASNFYIGSWGNLQYFNGKVPIVKTYNKALSAEEVNQNYNAYKNRFNI